MSQLKKGQKRYRLRKRKAKLQQVAKKSAYKPVARIKWQCSQCREIIVRKETENAPLKCPFCQDDRVMFSKAGEIRAV